MTTTEHAARIRADLKAKGITSRQVSVISDSYSMGSAIRIKIKDGSVSLKMVEEIAAPSEHIRRCEASGEILNGGNRYVDVSYTSEALAARRAPHMDAVKAAAETLEFARAIDPGLPGNTLVEILSIARLGRHDVPGWFTVWSDAGVRTCASLECVGDVVAGLVEGGAE